GPDAWADVLDTPGTLHLTRKRRESLANAATETAASPPPIGSARPRGALVIGAGLVVAMGLGLLSGRLLFGPAELPAPPPKRASSAAAAHAPPEESEMLPQVVEVEEPSPDSR